MRVLVLGGYGLIGSIVVRHLRDGGHEVVGLGRKVAQATRGVPDVTWIEADLAELTTPRAWQGVLAEANARAIVNCAGLLQDGLRDNVRQVQFEAMRALYEAAAAQGIVQFVQISAARADAGAETVFMRSKGDADAALAASALEWVVLRPGLVIAPQAYGGTALLRAMAAVPLVQPMAFGDRLVQTVAADDVARAVELVLNRKVAARRTYDLVEDRPLALREVVRQLRGWLGYAPAHDIDVPVFLVTSVARVADALGWLGWRSPLRTTAMTELAAGVVGDAAPWRAVTGCSLPPLAESLRRMPATVQERWFARAFMLKPVVIAVLALFWIATGLITLLDLGAATRVLTSRGWSESAASPCVLGGALIDVALGLAAAWRAAMPWAAGGMIAVTLCYLAGATLWAPDLWSDPLGPLVKAVPAMVLALVALVWAGDR